DEGAHQEGVVVIAAFEAQHGGVVVDLKLVIAVAAEDRERRTGALADKAARGFQRCELVSGGDTGPRIAFRAENLTDLEVVRTGAAVDRHRRGIAVDEETVIAAESVDPHL